MGCLQERCWTVVRAALLPALALGLTQALAQAGDAGEAGAAWSLSEQDSADCRATPALHVPAYSCPWPGLWGCKSVRRCGGGLNFSFSLPSARPASEAAPLDLSAEIGEAGAVSDVLQAPRWQAARPEAVPQADTEPEEQGLASWYGARFHRRRTASGERFDMNDFTAAHRTLPFGTLVCVRSLLTGRSVRVRINDRGPYVAGRVIDISQAAARALGLTALGTKPVVLQEPLATGRCPSESP